MSPHNAYVCKINVVKPKDSYPSALFIWIDKVTGLVDDVAFPNTSFKDRVTGFKGTWVYVDNDTSYQDIQDIINEIITGNVRHRENNAATGWYYLYKKSTN